MRECFFGMPALFLLRLEVLCRVGRLTLHPWRAVLQRGLSWKLTKACHQGRTGCSDLLSRGASNQKGSPTLKLYFWDQA